MDTLRYNDIGSVIRLTVKDDGSVVDVSSATTRQISFQKPDGTVVVKTASLYTDGSDGIVQYTTQDGDLNQIGSWMGQVYIVFANGSWHTDTFEFVVAEVLS